MIRTSVPLIAWLLAVTCSVRHPPLKQASLADGLAARHLVPTRLLSRARPIHRQ